MAREGQETISIGNYLLERLSQIGVQAGPYCPCSLSADSQLTFSHCSVFLVTSIWVSFYLFHIVKTVLTAIQGFWSVLHSYMCSLASLFDMATGSRRGPP